MRRAGGRRANQRSRNVTFAILVLAVIISFSLSLYGLRLNNLRVAELRQAVFLADERNEGVDQALHALAQHVTSHMNTNLRPPDAESLEKPIQLTHKYYRETLAYWRREIAEAKAPIEILTDARSACETDEYPIGERLNCLVEQTRNQVGFPQAPTLSKDFYTYDFATPRWSPDLAGFSLLVFGISLVALMIRLAF